MAGHTPYNVQSPRQGAPAGRVIAALVIIAAVIIIPGILYPALKSTTERRAAAKQAGDLVAKGDAALAEGRIDDAVFAYMRASKLASELPGVQLALGKALMLDGEGDAAIAAVRVEIQNNEDSIEAHLLLGQLHLLSAVGDDALGEFVMGALPDVMGYPSLSAMRLNFEETEEYPLTEALYHFKYAEELAPHEIRAAVGLAVMKALQGDYEEAESRLQEILQRDPSNEFAANALVRLPSLAFEPIPNGPGHAFGEPFVPGQTPGGDFLPPIDSSWDEFDPSAYRPEGGIGQGRPPDVTTEGTRELPLPGASGSQAPPSAMVTPEGDLILTEDAFAIKPITRPIGPVEFAPGKQSVPYVTVANRFDAGKVVLTPGQEGVVPNSGAKVTLKSVEGTNRVVIIEDGAEYLWVRGRVEWVLTPMDAAPATEEEMFEAIGSN